MSQLREATGISQSCQFWFSPFGSNIITTFYIAAGIILCIVLGIRFFIGSEAAVFAFVISFAILIFVPAIYSGIPTPFENNRKIITKFSGTSFLAMYHSWNPWKIVGLPFFLMIIYEDAIEIRAFFNAYLIPLRSLEKPVHRKWHQFFGFCIEVNLPHVPSRLDLYLLNSQEAVTIINELYKKWKTVAEMN